ncbi:MAG TPA: hypothetical protein VNR36_09480 [Pseudolysinimonas sp.]|nr:hypothetical protein [Pseudolysinimonas sp.]
MTQRMAIIPVVLAVGIALAGCSGAPEAEPTGIETSTPAPEPTETGGPVVLSFRLPADCTGLLPASRRQSFESQGIELLGGPGGKYPDYYADPTPEERAGGISCVWGDEDDVQSTLTVSAAPLSIDTRGPIIDELIAQGLNEAVVDDGISYAQIGDENSAPAVLNIIRDDSWISVIQATGGEKYFDLAVELAGEAAAQVYVP